jgi:hypothetical protein
VGFCLIFRFDLRNLNLPNLNEKAWFYKKWMKFVQENLRFIKLGYKINILRSKTLLFGDAITNTITYQQSEFDGILLAAPGSLRLVNFST